MGGNKEGAQKARDANLAKDPDYYKKMGARGGAAPHSIITGFGDDRVGKDGLTGKERARIVSKKNVALPE